GSSHSVAASKSGGLWITTDNGLSRIDGANVTNYTANSLLPNNYVKLCFEARNGDVYVEDGDKNINVFSDGRLLARLTNSNWVSAFAEDAKGILVSMGPALFRVQDGKFKRYQDKAEPSPDYYWINNLCTAKDGAIWVASKNGIF